MKTLAGSYFKFSPCKYREKGTHTVAWCSRESALAFLGHQKHFRVNLSLFAISSQNRYFHSISAAASSALPSAETQITDDAENLQIIDTDQQKTVKVRFKLQKKCAFSQQFLIVGDDPEIGLWEPSNGVPLNWSDGHLWIAEVDLPIAKVIKYKFILKEETGTISWQLGPDRLLETWDTETITVFEDWDNPELQNIVESDLSDEISVNTNLLIVDEGTHVEKEELDTNGCTNIEEKESVLLVAENIVVRQLDLSNSDTSSAHQNVIDQKNETIAEKDKNLVCLDGETRLVSDEEIPVLVPGLISMAPEENGEVFLSEVEREHDETTTSNVPNEVDELNVSNEVEELTVTEKGKHVPASLHPDPTETNQEMIDKKRQQEAENKGVLDSVLEGDKQWGRQTVQKFLASFGFQLS